MIKNLRLSLLTLAFSLLVIFPSVASAALTTTSATINGGSSVSVDAGSTVSLTVTSTVDGGSNWGSVEYIFATTTPLSTIGSTCQDTTPDVVTDEASTTDAFTSSVVPSIPGVYNLYMRARGANDCTGGDTGNVFELTNALTVNKIAQTIDFTTISPLTKIYGDTPVLLAATSDSSLPVTFTTSAASNICTVAGNTVTFTGAGSCPVSAEQGGDSTYAAAAPVIQTFIISPASLSLATVGAIVTKVYDATTTATLSGVPVVVNGTVFPGDTIGSVTAVYTTKNVGTQTVTLSLDGPDAFKYALTGNTITGDITPRTLGVVVTANNKVYDGTDTATVIFGDDRIPGDSLLSSGVSTFADKHVGNGKVVTVTGISLSGIDAGNYTPNATTSGTANITALPITLSAQSDSKVYDRTASSTMMPILAPTVALGDSYIAYQEFADMYAGVGKTITPFITITDGNSGNNYAVTTVTTTGLIMPKPVSVVDLSVAPKVYTKTTDGTIGTTTTPTLTGVITGDETDVSPDFSASVFTYNNSHAGIGKTVTVTGTTLVGTSSANYTLNPIATTGDILPRPITVTATSLATKAYDGSTTSSGVPTVTAGTVIAPDTEAFSQVYDDENVATGKTVIAGGSMNDGNGGANYTVTYENATDGVITPISLNVTAMADPKVYDGNADASAVVSLYDNRIGGELFTVDFASATYDNKHVGNGKMVTISGLTKSGDGADNYTFATTTIYTTGDVTAKTLTATPQVPNKVYDTTTSATVLYTDDRVSGDAIAVTGTAAFIDKTAGLAKTVLLSPVAFFGPDATNYTLSVPTTTTADIYQASTTASFTADNKVYDATTTATIATRSLSGVLGADTVTITDGNANFSDKNVGTGKTVTATGFVLGGADGNNYVIATTNTTTADITAKTLTPTVTADDKVYDGNNSAVVTITDDRISGDVLTINYASSTFDDKNVGNGKTVTATGFTVTGTDASNYTLSATSGTDTANITALSVTAAIIAQNKVYDGNNSATGTCSVIPVAGDDLSCTVNGTTTFADKNVGTGKVVTATDVVLAGVDMGNYALTSTVATGTADITKGSAGVTFTAADKVYDMTNSATILTSTTTGVIAGDDVSVSGGTASFDTEAAGNGKTVTATGFIITGTDAGNYDVATTSTTAASITQKEVTVSFTAANKVFNNTTAATINGRTVVSGVINSDEEVTVDGGVATFADASVGTGKLVSADTLTFVLGGADGANYTIATGTATTTADITAAPVTPTGSSQTFGGSIIGGGFSSGGGLTTGTAISASGTGVVACEAGFTKYMRFGRTNDKVEVIKLQKFLNTFMGTKLPLTGFFGTQTRAAVIKFQAKYLGARYATGLVMNMTIAEMNSMVCGEVESN